MQLENKNNGFNFSLQIIINANEEIKKLDAFAYSVRVRALNAHTLAARTGLSAAGYGILAHEIIIFSQKLEQSCWRLVELSHRIIEKTSVVVKKSRNEKLFQRCHQLCGQSKISVENMAPLVNSLDTIEDDINILRNENEQQTRAVLNDVSRLLRTCRDGKMMAVQSKIEAAYIKTATQSFKDAADDFEYSMETIEILLSEIVGAWGIDQ